jgi:hypothetical protein
MVNRTLKSSFFIDISGIKALYNLELLILGNVFNYPLPNLVILLVNYIYNLKKPLNTLIEHIIIQFRWNLIVI